MVDLDNIVKISTQVSYYNGNIHDTWYDIKFKAPNYGNKWLCLWNFNSYSISHGGDADGTRFALNVTGG